MCQLLLEMVHPVQTGTVFCSEGKTEKERSPHTETNTVQSHSFPTLRNMTALSLKSILSALLFSHYIHPLKLANETLK